MASDRAQPSIAPIQWLVIFLLDVLTPLTIAFVHLNRRATATRQLSRLFNCGGVLSRAPTIPGSHPLHKLSDVIFVRHAH
jgi:hypothetical protein